MDAERFDRITKALAAGASRRRLVGGLAALGLGGALAPERAGAQETPLLLDRSGPITQASDPRCKGERALNNVICTANTCARNPDCFCAETVNGEKKCVKIRETQRCPRRDQCDRNRDCGEGEACVKVGGCCGRSERNLCLPLCR